MRQQIWSEYVALSERADQTVTAATSMPALLKSVFGIADRNADGRLEAAELQEYLEGVLPHQTAVDAARLRFVP